MINLPVKNRLLGWQVALGVVLATIVIAVQFSPLDDIRARLRSQHVTTGLLDSGEKGKIIKSLGLVYGVREDGSVFKPYVPATGYTNLFRKKREKGEYIYRANPGSGYQLPSTLAVGDDAFRESWPLASLVIDPASLNDPISGIATNPYPRGRLWERRATFSLFQQGELVVAASIGVRIHGSDGERSLASGGLGQSYRLYFRNYYGADSVSAHLVFDEGETSAKRLVFRRGRPLVRNLAMDIAQRMDALVPHHIPAILYLNGRNLGAYSLQEHVSRRQWELRLGHDDFLFFRLGGTRDEASTRGYRELSDWLDQSAGNDALESISKRIDLKNLTRNLFVLMFCGSNDRFEETAVLDRTELPPRWRWITWELSDCFQSRWVTAGSDEPWSQAALRQVVARDPQTRSWKATYRSLRSDLFAQLLNDSPEYVEYFLRTVTDVLNHQVTAEFIGERYDHYEALLNNYRDPLGETQLEDLRTTADYLKFRPGFIRQDLLRAFNSKGVYTVDVVPHRARLFTVDGYTKTEAYSGKYFVDQRIEVMLPDVHDPASVVWRVNGKIVIGNPVRVDVTSDTIIELDHAGNDV